MSGRVRLVRRRTRFLGPLVAVGSLVVSGLALPGVAAADTGTATTFTYSSGGEQTYAVPAGATAVTVTAVGAPGGTVPGVGTGGLGADVTATVSVPAGTTTLYVEVGGAGKASPCNGTPQPATGGFNGGGDSPLCGGGGGGASDVRTTSIVAVPDSALTAANDSRLVTAGGGGGGGACYLAEDSGGTAGDSTVTGGGAGANACYEGGNGGFGAPGGSGGEAADLPSGSPGTLGQGGDRSNYSGGAGGGGYYGGGSAADGGGGAGSSFWVTGATDTSMSEDTTGTAEVTITPLFPPVDLSIVNTGSPDPVVSGQPLTYTVTATNTGGEAATGVIVRDVLPASAHFTSVATTQGSCTRSTGGNKTKDGAVTCRLGDLAGGTSATVTILVTPTGKPGTISATAAVTASNVTADDDDTATATTTVTGG